MDSFANWKKDYKDLYKEYLKRLEEYKDGDSITDIISNTSDFQIREVYSKNVRDAVPLLINLYKNMTQFILDEKVIISKVYNEMKNSKQNRTGWMDITVAFLNLGNTDGLISRYGTLYINDEIKIKIQVANKYAIPKVEKRSMLQLSFELNKNEIPPRDTEQLRRILIDNMPSKASVEVSDIRGKAIRSKNFSVFLLPDLK